MKRKGDRVSPARAARRKASAGSEPRRARAARDRASEAERAGSGGLGLDGGLLVEARDRVLDLGADFVDADAHQRADVAVALFALGLHAQNRLLVLAQAAVEPVERRLHLGADLVDADAHQRADVVVALFALREQAEHRFLVVAERHGREAYATHEACG